jgi:hypothetical protein
MLASPPFSNIVVLENNKERQATADEIKWFNQWRDFYTDKDLIMTNQLLKREQLFRPSRSPGLPKYVGETEKFGIFIYNISDNLVGPIVDPIYDKSAVRIYNPITSKWTNLATDDSRTKFYFAFVLSSYDSKEYNDDDDNNDKFVLTYNVLSVNYTDKTSTQVITISENGGEEMLITDKPYHRQQISTLFNAYFLEKNPLSKYITKKSLTGIGIFVIMAAAIGGITYYAYNRNHKHKSHKRALKQDKLEEEQEEQDTN